MTLKDKYFPVLDKGFIALKDVMGSDEDIEQAARVSYGKGTRKKSETKGLIRYLINHKHTSPLEMCEMKFHVRVPMDCWRQWIRHRTASVNEYSTRYSEAINLRQETPPYRWRLQSATNKQGSCEFADLSTGMRLSSEEMCLHKRLQDNYGMRLKSGVAREQARKDLPLSTYTEAYWKIDLHNLLHFTRLRCDSHAQLEIRSYANVIAGIVKHYFPLTFEAWEDYVFNAVTFSRLEIQLLDFYITYCIKHQTRPGRDNLDTANKVCEYKMSKRELDDFEKKMVQREYASFDINILDAKPYSYFREQQHEKSDKMAESTP